MMGDSFQNQALGKELRMDVTVVEELTEPKLPFVQLWNRTAIPAVNPDFSNGGG